MDEFVADRKLLFITATLPGGTDAAMKAIAEWSGWLVHSLKKWLFKIEKTALSLYCWEYQKRGALHLHYAVVIQGNAARERVLASVKTWWYSALCRVCDRTGVDLFERADGGSWRNRPEKIQVDAQVVIKSVARYLSKYLSKSVVGKPSSQLYCPSRWFGVSRSLSAIVRERTTEITARITSQRKFRLLVERLNSCVDSAEGVRWKYRDKSGLAEVQVFYPASAREGELLMNQVEELMADTNVLMTGLHRNHRELMNYWACLSSSISGYAGMAERSNPSRYKWLKQQRYTDAITTIDFVVVTRWLMSVLAAISRHRSVDAVDAADRRISDYVLKVLPLCGEPGQHWEQVSPELRTPNVAVRPLGSTVVKAQYRA
jgi:hypothetical protein